MKGNELRVGNLVEKNGEVFLADYITILMAHNYTPIRLTEEWLVKLGFKDITDSETKVFEKDGFSITKFRDKNWEFWVSESHNYPVNIEIKHTHQLQNLYFALTGEELKLKE